MHALFTEVPGDIFPAVQARLERLLSAAAAVSPFELPVTPQPASEPSVPVSVADVTALQEAVTIRDLLARNTEELDSVLKAMDGQYVLPAPGGDLLRDGAGVLPTGAWAGMHSGALLRDETGLP